ncbi:MAG: tRNA-dihydrouridine synthase family protein [Gemmataceae bacterium]|nr:tRNA-dihydrouridine synthase family protein [Gemmata sp.]MDW8199434.1 tRNA-dihydrouridine synthase family protein [Gemmataceae bacterium]
MLDPCRPAVILAPMEGVTDAPMRAVQGELGPFSFAVTEFLRITQLVPPRQTFLQHMPELAHGGRTLTGLPVQLQLLGGDAARMADSAGRAWELGVTAIDINFGCPAKTVNRHDGGAALLRYPRRIRDIVAAVRSAVPRHIPVSAKLRLGWDSPDAIDENAMMAAEGGATWITIHGRTRIAGYQPPIDWEPIGRVRKRLPLPVVANGDIWTLNDFRRCRDITGCRHFMLGRGAIGHPQLAWQVAAELGLVSRPAQRTEPSEDWAALLQRLVDWTGRMQPTRAEKMVSRLKQWLRIAALVGQFPHFDRIKHATTIDDLFLLLNDSAPPDQRLKSSPLIVSAPASGYNHIVTETF